jgi:putative salt-induced outer membrane protein
MPYVLPHQSPPVNRRIAMLVLANLANLANLAALAGGSAVASRAAAQDVKSVALIASGAAVIPDSARKKPVTSYNADLGFVSASGNTNITTLTMGDRIVHTDGYWMFSQIGTYVTGETNNKTTANQLRLTGRVDYALLPRLSVFGGVSYERNTFAGFNSRTDEIVGLAWKAILAPHDSARLDAGGVLTQEQDVDSTSQRYPSARAALSYKHQFSKLAYFHQFAEYIPNLRTSGSYRFNTESAVVAPISAHVGVKLAYAIRFDSRPQPTFGTTDRLLTTGIQISY